MGGGWLQIKKIFSFEFKILLLVLVNCFNAFVHDYRHKRTNVYLEFLGFVDCF